MNARLRTAVLLTVLAVPALPAGLAGLDSGVRAQGRGGPDPGMPSARAERTDGPMVVDGHLDEPAWIRAPAVTGFTQVEPDEGRPAVESTEVRILYDDTNLYIGARLFDSDTSRIARQLTRRDETGRAAGYLEFSLDPTLDRSTGYTFRVTAAGVQRDMYNYDDTRSDNAWDGVWESAVRLDEGGWWVEARVPLSQLRYEPSPEPQVWGVNFARRRIAANERSEWAFVPIGTHGTVSRWGRLEGLVLPEARRYAELVPFAMLGLDAAPAEAADPYFDGTASLRQVGADLRYGIGSTFVLDATLNPDFGQVEVDPRVINLTAFETFFPERRPFFTRDDRLFDFGLAGHRNNLFHSRRIGRSPQGRAPAGADFIDAPSETGILGAGKVTGRTSGGLRLGALLAVTGREEGRAYFLDDDEHVTFAAEPPTRYGTVRFQQELRGARSRIGGIVTVVDRDLPAHGSLDFLPHRAFSAGLDFEHMWSDREWAVWGFMAGSHVRGGTEALVRLQRAPNHYYQRPDQEYLELDSAATSLTGAEWRLQFERRSGRHWTGALWAGRRTPGFEVNDLGFSNATERIDAGARLQYREPTPGPLFRNYRVALSTDHSWRHEVLDDVLSARAWGDARKAGEVRADVGLTFLNWWGLNIDAAYEPEVLSDILTRGGPLMVDPGSRELRVSGTTDQRDLVTFRGSVGYEDGLRGGGSFSTGLGLEARPTSGVVLSLGPSYRRQHDIRQYVATFQDSDFAPTFGARYLFAELHRQELAVETRFNLILSPHLSLEVFAQPLISAGDFTGYRELARSGSFEFREFVPGTAEVENDGVACVDGDLCRHDGRIYLDHSRDGTADASIREQDFTVRSLRGSAVLRWEYHPGSRLYLVWQHSRQGRDPSGAFELGRDARALFDAPGRHTFMIKIDHWIDL